MADTREVGATEAAAVAERLAGVGRALRARPLDEIIAALGRAGARFLDDEDPIRQRALERLPEEARVTPPMAASILDGMAADWTEQRLRALVTSEFGDPAVLDGIVTVPVAGGGAPSGVRRVRAFGPRLCVQIVSGSVPGVSVHALIRSLLVKSPTLLKPGRGDTLLPRLFAEALAEEDAGLSDALEVAYWPGGSNETEGLVLQAADVAVIYGSDETVEAVRARAPATTRVVAYHHRVGVGAVGRGALDRSGAELGGVVSDLARAVALFEQRGCVCPQVVFVEEGGETSPSEFARAVAGALGELEAELPSPGLTTEEAAGLAQLRGTAEMHQASGRGEVHHGGGDAPWTVVFEVESMKLPAVAPRTLRVRPLPDLAELPGLLASAGPHLQSVGHAGLGDRVEELADALGLTGASRVVPFRALSFPPPWWLHDGREPLNELVRWMEVEEG